MRGLLEKFGSQAEVKRKLAWLPWTRKEDFRAEQSTKPPQATQTKEKNLVIIVVICWLIAI